MRLVTSPGNICDGCANHKEACEWPVRDWKWTCRGCIENHFQCTVGGMSITQHITRKSVGLPRKWVKSKEAVKEETKESGSKLEGEDSMRGATKIIVASLDGIQEEMRKMWKMLKVIAGYTEMLAKAMGCFVHGKRFLRMWEMGAVEGEQSERAVRPWSEEPEDSQQGKEPVEGDIEMKLQ